MRAPADRLPRLAVLVALLALGGCAAPPYRPGNDTPTALIDLKLVGKEAEVCIAGKMYSLKPDKQGIAKIPGDGPVNLRRWYYYSEQYGNYIKSISCGPVISFDSVAGESYVLDGFVGDGLCRLELFRADPKSRVGVQLEPTVRPFSCPAEPASP